LSLHLGRRLELDRAISPHQYSGLIRNLFEVKGSRALDLPGSLQTTIIAENDRAENLFAQRHVPFSQYVAAGPSVGNTSHAGIRNLTGSGYIATAWLLVNNDTGVAADFTVGFLFPSNGNLVLAAQVTPSDSRLTTFAPGLFTINFNGASQSNVVGRVALQAGDNAVMGPWVMAPNSDLFVTAAAVNQVAATTVFGYCRPLRASELQR